MVTQWVRKAQVTLENVSIGFSSGIVGIMMVLTTVDVVCRYIFNRPIPSVYTICEFLLIGVVFPAQGYVQRIKGNIRVDIIIDKVKGPPRLAFELAALVLALVTFAIVFWESWGGAWDAWVTGDFDMGLIALPYWPPKLVMAIGFGLLCLRFITDIKDTFSELRESSPRWISLFIISISPLAAFVVFFVLLKSGQADPMTVGWIMVFAMIVLLLSGLPVAFGLLLVGAFGYWVLAGPVKTFSMIGIIPFEKISDYTLSVIPLFILMGHFAYQAGFASAVYGTTQKWIGWIPGSMAQATVVGGAAFGAACGAGVAGCATLGKICIPVMRDFGIDRRMALGTVAAVGGIAALIPPSIVVVVIALITDQSVGKLLIAGIIPGLLSAATFMALIYIKVKINPKLAPRPLTGISWKQRLISLKDTWGVGVLAVLVLGGIYTGIFTPTEAGALGAAGAFVLALITGRLNWRNLKEALTESTKTTASLMLILAMAMIFGNFLAISRIPAAVSDFILNLHVHRLWILIGVLLLFIVAGMFMDMISFCFLTLPIIYPAMLALGYNRVWFGIIIVILCELALITPPFGLNLFVLKGMMDDIKMGDVIWGSVPFALGYIFVIALCVAFPPLITWLPSLMK